MNKKIINTIKDMPSEKVHEEVSKREKDAHLIIINTIHKRADNICYSRTLCNALNINYCEIRGIDYEKAKLAAWLETEL